MTLGFLDFFTSLYLIDLLVWLVIGGLSVAYLFVRSHRSKVSIAWNSEEFLIRTGLVALSCASAISVASQFQTNNPALSTAQFLTTLGLVLWFRDVAAGLKSKLDTFVPASSGTVNLVQSQVKNRQPRGSYYPYLPPPPSSFATKEIDRELAVKRAIDWITDRRGLRLRNWEVRVEPALQDGGYLVRGTGVDEYVVTHSFLVFVLPDGHINESMSQVS